MALKRIAALWRNTKKDSKAKLTGKIEIGHMIYPCFLFENEHKEGKQPDYRLSYNDEQGEENTYKKAKDDEKVPF